METRIGKKIIEYRKEHGLSIKDFAQRSELSTALISQLERGIGNPSLSVLKAISRVLGISLPTLLVEDIDNGSLIRRKNEQEKIHNPNEKNAVYYALTPGPVRSNVELLQMTLKPFSESNSGFSQHFEEEIAYIVEGEAVMVFEHEEFLLKQEDTIRILPSRKHKLRNASPNPVKVLFIKSKVTY
ncbi:MAG: XRE family transcriptional regulator [Victivallaceae bacterium]|nr:XRE family transcriptional regulator [Victivallaceae bacterium]MDD4318452.1 XRE family transcriptional regulator [Victivallaceae bacterium]MDD5664126.1 XRE family transcriptional regulator [Victivallaceae bacterium]NLK83798.1 helix-turn-helix domain-containing protein [Lentisphaerota bacterium]